MCGAFYYSRTNGRIFTLKMRHPERSEGSPEDGMVFNSEMFRVKVKDDVPRVNDPLIKEVGWALAQQQCFVGPRPNLPS